MNKYYLNATNARRWKYERINLRLRHSNNADKKFQQSISMNFEIIQSDTIKKPTTVIWISIQPISNYNGDTENPITP